MTIDEMTEPLSAETFSDAELADTRAWLDSKPRDVESLAQRLLATIDALTEERDRLRSQRDKAATTLEMVKALADGYSWLSEGRGSYEWDDGRYDDDVRTFTSQLLKLLPRDRWLGLREWEAKYREAEEERDRLRAALRQVTRRRTAWLSIGAINNVAEIRVERELFEEWVRLIPALEGQE